MEGSRYLEQKYRSAFYCGKLKLALLPDATTGNLGEILAGRRLCLFVDDF